MLGCQEGLGPKATGGEKRETMINTERIKAAALERNRKSFISGVLVIAAIYLGLTLLIYATQDEDLRSLWTGPLAALQILPIPTAFLIAAVAAQVTAGWFRPSRIIATSTYVSVSLLAIVCFMMGGLGRCG